MLGLDPGTGLRSAGPVCIKVGNRQHTTHKKYKEMKKGEGANKERSGGSNRTQQQRNNIGNILLHCDLEHLWQPLVLNLLEI